MAHMSRLGLGLLALVGFSAEGCMVGFSAKADASKRDICQSYVDNASPYIGQQQGLGVALAVAAVFALGIGAAVANGESGNFASKNRKALLVTGAGALALLCYNFLGNAQAAAASAAQASLALANSNDGEMWAGCQRARAAYFDARAAGISATRDAITKDTSAPDGRAASSSSPPPSGTGSHPELPVLNLLPPSGGSAGAP